MRILMLLARTGRRANEILMLDYGPLLPVGPTGAADGNAFAARLRDQQTTIDGWPGHGPG
jgi:hypothetical protein